MANTQLSGPRFAYAKIDEAPGTGGFWSAAVSMSQKNTDRLSFSFSGGGVGEVTIQYKLPHIGAAWQDYDSPISLVDGVKAVLDDKSAGVRWRVGIKEDTSADPTFTSGDCIVGFDW